MAKKIRGQRAIVNNPETWQTAGAPSDAMGTDDDQIPEGPRELIVVTRSQTMRREAAAFFTSRTPVADLLPQGVRLTPLFGPTLERARAFSPDATELAEPAALDLGSFFRVDAPEAELEQHADRLREHETIEAVYLKPAPRPAVINTMRAIEAAPPATTPNFTPRQAYLDAAPAGVNARFAWKLPGGGGHGVRVIDIEGAWRFTHEDLLQNQGGIVGGTPSDDVRWRNHGTAVVGLIGADRNPVGVTGIAPEAHVRAISIFGVSVGQAIRKAADMLSAGDIILIELHFPGPRFGFQDPQGQRGFIAAEWWPDHYAAIQYATRKGVIVVEAAGNGAENLDDAIYDVNPRPPFGPFPPWWKNPFRRLTLDSGGILVGAGAPPPGTHGRNHGPDRSRLDFSNFGSAVDAQGWGREVTTCGYGDLQGGTSEDLWYTDEFSGTSSASPIVVGSLACVQGTLRTAGRPGLTPATARSLLRSTGSPQQGLPERIGNRPDIRAAIEKLVPHLIPADVERISDDLDAPTVVTPTDTGATVNINIDPAGLPPGATLNINVNSSGASAAAQPMPGPPSRKMFGVFHGKAGSDLLVTGLSEDISQACRDTPVVPIRDCPRRQVSSCRLGPIFEFTVG